MIMVIKFYNIIFEVPITKNKYIYGIYLYGDFVKIINIIMS